MLTIHQISSHDAKGAARYFEGVVESERKALEQMGSYYESGLGRGGVAFGDDLALQQLGIRTDTLSGKQLERLLEGKSADRPDLSSAPERFEVDLDRLAGIVRRRELGEDAQKVLDVVDNARERGRRISAGDAQAFADRFVAAGAIAEGSVPMKERLVRTAGRSLDHSSLRLAIENVVKDRGGLDGLSAESRSSIETLRDMELGEKRHADRMVLKHARVLEGDDLLVVKDHMRATVNSQDLTLSAPKSVSVLWAACDSDRRRAIEQAIEASAHAAVEYMGQSVACLQRKDESGKVHMERADGVAATSYLHFTARGVVDVEVADPQLHVHCIVSGVLRNDGVLVAPNQREWVKHGREGGSYFRADLADRLRSLGIAIEQHTGKDGRYFEVAGIPRELCDAMSQRSRVIEEAIEEFKRTHHGRMPTPAERDAIVVRSRLGKGATAVDLDGSWQETCATFGLDEQAVDKVFNRRQLHIERGEARVDLAREEILQRLHERGATATDREVRSIAYEATAGAMTPHKAMELVDTMQRDGLLISLEGGLVTTLTVEEAEMGCLTLADRKITPLSDATIDKAIATAGASSGFDLSEEQQQAVRYALGDRAVSVVVGLPGSGKGTVIRGVSAGLLDDGSAVVAVATQGARSSGVGAQSLTQTRTITSLLAAMDHDNLILEDGKGRLRPARAGDTVLIDEGGMVDTFTMNRVLTEAEKRGLRVIIVGDHKQLDAIGVAGILEPLADATGAAELHEVFRTKEEHLKTMQNHIRNGESEHAIAILKDHGCAHLHDTSTEAIDAMLGAWDSARGEVGNDQAVMLVHSSNRVVDEVNVRAQAKRLDAGELGTVGVRAPDRDYLLHEGDLVMFRSKAYQVEGDRRVENGTRGLVVNTNQSRNEVTVRVEEPRHAPRDVVVKLDECEALRLSYASHVYPAQGDTYERTFELAGGLGTGNAASYVGASRTRERHDLFTSRDVLEGVTDAECWQILADQMNERSRNVASITLQREARQISSEIPPTKLERLEHAATRVQRRVERYEAKLEEIVPIELRPRVEQRRLAHRSVTDAREELALARADLDVVRTQTVISEPARKVKRRRIDECRERLAERSAALDAAKVNLEKADRRLQMAGAPADVVALQRRVDDARVARDRSVVALQKEVRAHPPAYVQRSLRSRPMDHAAGERWDARVNELVELRVQTQSRTRKAPMRRRAMEREGRAFMQQLGDRFPGDRDLGR